MGNSPNTAKILKQRREIRVVDASIQGRRSNQEDRHVVIDSLEGHPEIALFGVFDGHNGDACADYCKNNLHVQLSQRIHKKGFITPHDLEEAFLQTDGDFLATDAPKTVLDSGCTAVTAVFNRITGQLFTANCGDARCLISRNGKAQGMTIDHKPVVPAERKRIEDAGRKVEMNRLDGCLAVSRAMGDMTLKIEYDKQGQRKPNPYLWALSPAPYVQETVLGEEDEFIVLACDGLFDVMSNQQVVDWVRANRDRSDDTKVLVHPDLGDEDENPKRGKPSTLLKSQSKEIAMMVAEQNAAGGRSSSTQADLLAQIDEEYKPNLAQELAHYAVKLGSMDNISVVIVFLDAIPAQAEAREKQQKAAEEEQKKLEKERKKQEQKRLKKEKKLRQKEQQLEAQADVPPADFASQETESDQQ